MNHIQQLTLTSHFFTNNIKTLLQIKQIPFSFHFLWDPPLHLPSTLITIPFCFLQLLSCFYGGFLDYFFYQVVIFPGYFGQLPSPPGCGTTKISRESYNLVKKVIQKNRKVGKFFVTPLVILPTNFWSNT